MSEAELTVVGAAAALVSQKDEGAGDKSAEGH